MMAAPSPPRLSAAWQVEANSFSAAFLFVGRQLLHAHVPFYCELNQTQCSRPYGTATYYLQTAFWLGTCQLILTQTERSNEPDLVCHRVSPLSSTTCLPVGPMSLEWPLAQPGGPFQPDHSPLHEDANSDCPGNAHLGPPHQRWRRHDLQLPEVLRGQPTRDTCVHVPTGGLRCVSWNTRGFLGSTASSQRSREQKHIYLTRLARNSDIICLQETQDEFLQAVQILHTQFRLFGTFTLNNVNAGGSPIFIHKNLLPGGAITHVTTWSTSTSNLTWY